MRIYVCDNNIKKGHEFVREQGTTYGRDWKEERGKGNDVIIISKINNKNDERS